MITIDQNSAITSLNNALVPSSCLIDSRSEIDRLSFLAKFASLINFYDHTNKVNGDWSPFLLKDPIFLIASIATTPFHEKYLKYIKVSSEFTKKIINPREIFIQIENLKREIPTLEKEEKFKDVNSILIKIKEKQLERRKTERIPVELVDVLFEQILNVFRTLQLWTYYLGKSEENFNLKKYVFDEVKRFYSKLLWGILSFKEYLFLNFPQDKIKEVNWSSFQSFDKELWQLNRSKTPFWILFGFVGKDDTNNRPNKNNIYLYYRKLIELGDQLFSFFNTIIEYSLVEFSALKTKKNKFPDTTLLRTFTQLLDIYKNQLNGVSSKHLDFYYRDILKQHKKVASADSVFVCVDLVEDTSSYSLPKDTLFLAGDYEDTMPILFSNEKPVSTNPAIIDKVYTLSKINDTTGTDVSYTLNLIEHSDVSIIKKNEDDIVEGWKTFGSSQAEENKEISLGFAFASPILLLQEGTRTITIVFTLKDDVVHEELFTQATYYLSTETDWYAIPKLSDTVISGKIVTLTIILDEFVPPIKAFAKAKDGVESAWPICKLVFSKFNILKEVPKITSLYIKVDVKGLKTFQLYNDFGQLETKKPFQLFGPTPAKDQNFIIGSREIFSKKVNTLNIRLDWDNLPQIGVDEELDNFETYYEKYIHFIRGDYNKIDDVSSFADSVKSFMAGFGLGFLLSEAEKSKIENIKALKEKEKLFSNTFFKVTFQSLQHGDWIPVVMDSSLGDDDKEKEEIPCPLLTITEEDVVISEQPPLSLFQEINLTKSYSSFGYLSTFNTQKQIDPTIQNDILEFSDTSTSGFLKMQLTTDPPYGFGLLLYPKVISAIALYNAGMIAKIANDGATAELIDVPNEPYTPTVHLFTGDYTSCVTYTFDEKKDTYPLDCFYYDTFCNYKIYDNQRGYLNLPKGTTENGISIYKNFTDNGALFIALTNLITPAEVRFYFELTSTANKAVTDTSKISYNYLSIDGWKPLEVLSDETYGFSCSGIIIFNIPGDITKGSHTVPGFGDSYYISISVQDDLSSYPETTFLKTNGMKLKRVDTKHSLMTETPFINAGSILTVLDGIPEIAEVIQPFSSFGGVAAENNMQMQRRVSTRLKTKDRLVSKTDYYRVIKEKFPSIYYLVPNYNKIEKRIHVYVLKVVKNEKDANAYKPYVTICKRLEIKNFIETRTPAFKEIQVLNFEFRYIRVYAKISIRSGNEISGVEKNINPNINTFLSPWINTNQEQVKVGNTINAAQIALFIKSQPEIENVKDVSIEIGSINPITKEIEYLLSATAKEQSPKEDNILFVPSLDNSKINYS